MYTAASINITWLDINRLVFMCSCVHHLRVCWDNSLTGLVFHSHTVYPSRLTLISLLT